MGARWALGGTYGNKDMVMSGPLYQNAEAQVIDGKKMMVVGFISSGDGLAISGEGELQGFTIAGDDGKFVVAKAQIMEQQDGKLATVKVWSDKVKNPVAVRYAWEDNPTEANLVNSEGLPASPFRTDDFKGPTDGRR